MKTLSILFFILVFQICVFGQARFESEIEKRSCSGADETAAREFFERYDAERQFIARCDLENEEKRKSSNQKRPVKVSGFGPGPVSLVKPFYPEAARRWRISGEVLLEVYMDETGSVVFSNILKGSPFLRESALKASCRARFTPVLYCGKFVRTRWLLRYLFHSD